MEKQACRRGGVLRLKTQQVVAIRLIRQWLCAGVVAIAFALLLQFFGNATATAEERATLRSQVLFPMALALIASAPIVALDLARFSHAFIGPVTRLRGEVGRLADGQQVAPVVFRKNDHWHDLADEFNRLSREVERLREIEQRHNESPTETTASA